MAANIPSGPDLRNAKGAACHHYFHHFSKVAEVAEIKREAKTMSAFGFSFWPAAVVQHLLNDCSGAGRMKRR